MLTFHYLREGDCVVRQGGDGQRLLSVGRWLSDIEAPWNGEELVADARLEEASCCVAIGEESPTVEEGHW